MKVNSLSFGTMAESCWESSSEEELFFTQSTFTAKSEEHDGKYLLSVVAIHNIFYWHSHITLMVLQQR